MTVNLSLDHAVISVEDLSTATEDYSALGFTVVPGGEHESGFTHNSLIAFADGSYLELIGFKNRWGKLLLELPKRVGVLRSIISSRPGMVGRFLPRSGAGEGLLDFALCPEVIEDAITGARRSGLEIHGPLPGTRVRPDGRQVSWQCGFPPTLDLPFLCADVTPRSLRVPEGAARQHPNGVKGMAGVVVAVKDLEVSTPKYTALLGVGPRESSAFPLSGANAVDFTLNSATITLAAPMGEDSGLHQHLARRGEGPYLLRLRASGDAGLKMLDTARTHGARIEVLAS